VQRPETDNVATRRQEKLARQIQRTVSDVIANHLSDPRIEGLVSITRVEAAADLRAAEVYLSVLAKDAATEELTLTAIEHARPRIQAWLADELNSRFCPVLHLRRDAQFKKSIEIMNLIDRLAADRQPSADQTPEDQAPPEGSGEEETQGRTAEADEAPDERQ
jgi:ribosome-binding factor A